MSAITTHVLDASTGAPAAGMSVELQYLNGLDHTDGTAWTLVDGAVTDPDGRAPGLAADAVIVAGTYRLRFGTGTYFAARDVPTFYPVVELTFTVLDPGAHHHVPLLLSPFAFSTYRGS